MAASDLPDIATVIVPTINRPGLLRRALDSLRAQTCHDFEVVVINDGGLSVAQVVEAYADLHIIYLEHPEVRGLSAARNTAIANSRGRWIAYLDDDDSYTPTHLEGTLTALRGGVSRAVFSDQCVIFERRADDGTVVIEEERERAILDFSPEEHFARNPFPPCCAVHDRQCLERTGGFDESLTVCEDYDLWLRFQRAGFAFRRVPGAAAGYHTDLNASQMTAERINDFVATLEKIYARHADHARTLPGVEDGQQRYLRYFRWRAQLTDAYLRVSGGARTLNLGLGDVIFARGFGEGLWELLYDANWGPNAMPTSVSGAGPRLAPGGPYGRKWLLRQLLREIFRRSPRGR